MDSPIDNPTVWCERCRRYHKKYTFTKKDRQRIVKQMAKRLSDDIDRRAMEEFYKNWGK